MKTLTFVLLAALVTACASEPSERKVIADAAAALGGAGGVIRLQAIAMLTIEGSGIAPSIGQNRLPEAEEPVWKITEYERLIDLLNNHTRVRQVREAQFLFAGATVQRQIQGLDGDVAYNVAADGTISRASDAAARDRRIELLHHPIPLVRAALDPAATVANHRTEGDEALVDITTAAGDLVTLAVDRSTHLPSRILTIGTHPNLGDVVIETTIEDYSDAGGLHEVDGDRLEVRGLQLPRRLTTRVDRHLQLALEISSYDLGSPNDVPAIPEAVRQTAPPPQAQVVVTVEPVAKGVWWLAGSGNHRSIVFEFDDHMVLYEAPLNEARTKAVIDTARTLSPKPLTTAIVSHHHFDHSGGLRVAVAEGLTIVTHRANEAFFRSLLARPHTIVPDALQRNPTEATFQFVDDQLTLKDGSMEVQLYHLLDNPREGTNLFAYVPHARLLVQADLYDAGWQRHPWGANVLSNLERRQLRIERSVPVHGIVEPFTQMVKTIHAGETGASPR